LQRVESFLRDLQMVSPPVRLIVPYFGRVAYINLRARSRFCHESSIRQITKLDIPNRAGRFEGSSKWWRGGELFQERPEDARGSARIRRACR
jgi:hypothetical protein